MTLRRMVSVLVLAGVVLSLLALVPNHLVRPTGVALAASQNGPCLPVNGMLMTDINAIAGATNLGPASGDLAGSVAATILGQNSDGSYNVQHYWVTTAGDKIKFHQAVLHPTYPVPNDPDIVAVPWGNYRADIEPGGTGRFQNATGYIYASGMANFHSDGLGPLTIVFRYTGQVCYNDTGNQQ